MILLEILKINKKYLISLIINLALILNLSSCSGEGCVDGDDFGDQESQTLTIYSNTNQTSCDYDPGVPDTDQKSELIKACLLENSKSIVDRNGTTFNSTTGCKGFTDAELNRLCKDKCVNDCQINSTSMGAQPSWTSNTALLSDSGSGVNIPKNSEITITAKGNMILGNDIALSPVSVAFNEIMPHSYASSASSAPSIIDVNKGQSINIKFSKNSTANVDGSNPIGDYNFARRLVGYIIPHPQNYDFMLSDPVNGHLNVPLTPRFNGWKCSYSSNDSLQSECSYGSKEIDAYNADTNSLSLTDLYSTQDSSIYRVNNVVSSSNFDVSSELKKLIDYGGFIRWKNDPFKNYSYDPFASVSCSASGVCSVIDDPNEGVIVGDLTGGFSYTNNDAYSKEASFKLIGSFCPNLSFSELAVYNQANRKIYYITNFNTSSSYSTNKIPLYAGYKITLTPNSTRSSGLSVNCGNFLAMRMIRYNDVVINKSGFVSFRIVDHDSSQASQSPSCTISARIINPNGDHPVINDSATLASSYNFRLNGGSLNLPMPPSNLLAEVSKAYSGTLTLNSAGSDYITSNSDCFEDISQQIKDRYAQCFASNINPCVLNTTSASFSSFSNCSTSGIGENGLESSNSSGGGSGGGGGGNLNGIATLNSSSGSGIAGTSGTSFYNEFFHNTNPTTSTPSSSISGYKGVAGINGSNGQVKIYNCATGASCAPTIFNYNSAVRYQTYNVPASGTVRYEIYGAGGGGGGSSCGSVSNTLGGEGANGTIVTGELKNIDATKTPRLRIYIGAGGPAGYSACSANYSNAVSYSTPFSFTSVSPSKFSKINFASYGFPVISTRNLTSSSATHNFAINPYCHSSASKVIAVDNCIGNSTCNITLANSTFNSIDLTGNCSATGNGENGASNTSSDNNGSGGGAGGGNGSLGTSASASGTIAGGAKGSNTDGNAGTSGDSYYDPGYHSSQPTVASANNANTNGSATITPSGGSASSFTNVGSSTYTVPAGVTSLGYVIKGAGGGNGGNASASRTGGTGASGTQLTGSISVSAGDVIDINIGEKGHDGAGVCGYNFRIILEGSSINLSSSVSANSPIYGTPQRTSDSTYTANTYCNSSTASTNFNSNLSNTNFLINDTNLGTPQNTGISPAETCQNGQGNSGSSSDSLTNAGGGGGAGGGNGGTSTSGIINGGTTASNTAGGAGTSGESFFQPYYHQTAPASVTTATNQANASQSASDGVAILKQTSSSGTVLKNLTSATSDSYTVTADGLIYYELTGAGGGKGGKNSQTQSTAVGNGAGGAKISGILNVKNGDVIKIYVGKAGGNAQSCGIATNYSNASEFSPVIIPELGCNIATIDYANYGTPNTSSTPYTDNSSCSSGSLTTNSNFTACIGQSSCTIYATNNTAGSDPCPPNQTLMTTTTTGGSVGENGNYGISLPTSPATNYIDQILFASYGLPNTSNWTTSWCHSSSSLYWVQEYCLGKNSCTVPASNGLFGDPCWGVGKALGIRYTYLTPNSSANQYAYVGGNFGSSDYYVYGGSGGGGGGSYQATAGGSGYSNQNSGAGATGPSFWNTTYISSTPTITSGGGSRGSKGLGVASGSRNGSAGGNGSIKICNTDTTTNCTTNSTPGVYEVTIPSGGFYFEVSGGGGGGGSPNIYARNPQGGDGASGSKVTGTATLNLTANDKIYVYVGGGGGGGSADTSSATPGQRDSSSLYFLGANAGSRTTSYKGVGGAGGSASFIVYKGNVVVLASGGGGGGGGGQEEGNFNSTNGDSASSNTTLNSASSSSFFTYTLKKLAVQVSCANPTDSKGIGGAITASGSTINILKGGNGGNSISGGTCKGGGGGGGGGASALMINDETVAIAGGGGGGGGNNSSSGGTSASANTNLRNYLKVVPDKKYLVFNFVQNYISSPTKSTSDTKILGGTGGTINGSSGSYCSVNSNGQGGDGGGGTMLSINNRVIAIAGGGGGGGGASINGSASSSRNASNSHNILDKLKAGPFGPYLAISAEYRSGTTGYVNSSQVLNGSNLIINTPASSYFNDIAFASYGDNSNSPFLFANTCSNEANLTSLLQTNCLEKNTCTSAISSSLGGGQSCSNPANYKALAKLTYQSSLQSFASAPVSSGILLGGNGGKNGLKECSGGGGAGGGATAISVESHSDYTDAQEQFVAIAGGGGGGGGASCSGAISSTANGSNPNTIVNTLSNKALGTWLSAQISFPRPSVRNVPEDYYEYDDFAIADASSADPLKSLSVNSAGFTAFSGSTLNSNKIFVRKGQIIRFSPSSWQGSWNTKNSLSRQCGVGMVIQIEPRPALVCLGSKNEKIINPNCIPDFSAETDSSIPLGCKGLSTSCNGTYNAGLNKYVNICNGICQKKITCSTAASEANNYTKSGCSLTSAYEVTGDGISCSLKSDSNPADANTNTACNNCNNARLAASQLPFYLNGNFDQCFDLENYTGKVQNLVANQTNQSIIDSYISNKGLTYLKPFNGEYGNFENYNKISDHNYELKSPINSALKGRLRFFVVDGYDLNIPSLNTVTYTNFYNNNNGFATINPTVSLTARNGQWLQIKLCKEDSQTSRNCRSTNIDSSKDLSTANKSQAAVIDIASSSPLSFSSINYKFNSDGVLYRETDPIAGKDCNSTSASSVIASGVSSAVAVNASGVSSSVSSLLTPNASVVTSKNSKFYCHTDNTDSKLLRLSFKIFDPEILNCNTITGSRSSAAGAFDGIILKNNYYNSNTSANTGAVCTNSELASKNCEKEFICIDKYANNTGTYEVKIKVKKNLGATQLINSIIEPVLFWLDGNPLSSNPNERIGFAEYIYKSLITNVIYVSILKMTMVLAIMFYGLGYLMGVSELSQTQIITRAFKIGFIYLFVGETGWQWFKAIFVDFYKDGVAQAVFLMTSAFNEAPEIRQALDTNNFSNKAILFSGVDQVITILFSSAIHKKIWAFLFTGIFGWSYILIFYFSILNFIFALANSILLFLTAQVMISLLFIMGPLFLIFLLFSQTKDMFDNWLKAMTGFALQQIFLLTTLAFFNMLFVEVLKMSLGYGVCWDDAWVINLGLRFTITKFWVISSLPPRTNMSDDIMETGNPESIPSLFSILYIWVVASLMKKMVTLMTDVATSISDGIKASEIGQGIAAIGSKIKGAGASAASNALSSMTSGLDDKLFDSGSIAKKKRNALEDQAKSDMAARKTLLGAADEAEKAYKSDPNNIAKLGDMSKEEQNKEIQRVRSEAMDKKAAKMGIKGKNKERIINGTGLKYQGNNVFGALYQAGKQGIFTGGALKTSIADREGMGTKIGREEANKAAKSMNPQQAEKFAKDIAEGKINVERNRKEKAWDNKKRIGAAVLTGGLSELGLRANRAISDRVSQSRFGEIRKLAVSQLEEEGKIAKTGSTSMRTRNDDDQKMIRDRMRAIGDERKDKGKKDLGKKIGAKSSRSFRKRFNNKKKSLQKAINEALKNNDLDKYSKLSDIEDAINNAEFTSDDEDNYNSANELMNDFNKTDFDKNDSIDDLMSKDSFNNLKNK